MGVDETVPPVCGRVKEEVQPLPLVVEIAKSAGAVTRMSCVRLLPDTE